MDNPLRNAWESMNFPDGTPDRYSRTKALDGLILSLPSEERFRIRLRLNEEPRDPCKRLNDVLLYLVDYLDPEDLVSASQVSKTWRATWTSPMMAIRILQRHFYDKFIWYQRLEGKPKEIQREWLVQWLPGALRDRVARMKFRARARLVQRPKRNERLPEREKPPKDHHQYCNGLVAQRSTPTHLKVTSLFTKKSKIYTSKDRIPIVEWILGDQFLIGLLNTRNVLVAWSLKNDDVFSIKLPSSAGRSSLHQNRAAVMLDKSFIVWKIGKSTKSFEYPIAGDNPCCSTKEIIMHPYDQEKFYLIYLMTNPRKPVCGCKSPLIGPSKLMEIKMFEWSKHQFKGEVLQYHIDALDSIRLRNYQGSTVSFSGSDGLYTIINWLGWEKPPYPDDDDLISLDPLCSNDNISDRSDTAVLLDLDLTKKKPAISLSNAHSHRYHQSLKFAWHGQLLCMENRPFIRSDPSRGSRWHLNVNHGCKCHTTPHEGDDYSVKLAFERYGGNYDTFLIAGDDDFVVVFGIDGYEVHCFLSLAEFERRKRLCQRTEESVSGTWR